MALGTLLTYCGMRLNYLWLQTKPAKRVYFQAQREYGLVLAGSAHDSFLNFPSLGKDSACWDLHRTSNIHSAACPRLRLSAVALNWGVPKSREHLHHRRGSSLGC